jgi:hypothetical protein
MRELPWPVQECRLDGRNVVIGRYGHLKTFYSGLSANPDEFGALVQYISVHHKVYERKYQEYIIMHVVLQEHGYLIQLERFEHNGAITSERVMWQRATPAGLNRMMVSLFESVTHYLIDSSLMSDNLTDCCHLPDGSCFSTGTWEGYRNGGGRKRGV